MFNGKTVLVVGEDSLIVYGAGGGKAKRLGSFMWEEENLMERLVGYLLREGRKKPVYILYDMLEQQYKKEIVPKLSPLDKRAYINRKLKVVFPSNPMRAAYFLKGEAEENLVQGKVPDEGTPYIFASIPDVPQFDIIYDAIKKSELQLLGIGFLPIEATGLIKKLASSDVTGGFKSKWNVLLSVHESGGLRQIITKNGELALTRLTAVSSDASDPEAWGREAGQEFKSTLSYLLRFGYTQDQTMDIFIVNGHSEVKDAFQKQIDIQPAIYNGSPEYLGRLCGLKVQNTGGEIFGDILHAAWIGKVRGMRLPVASNRFEGVIKTRKYLTYASKAMFLVALLGLGYSAFVAKSIQGFNDDTAKEQVVQAALQNELREKEQSIPTIVEGIEFEKIISLLNVYDKLESKGIKSMALVHAIANNLPSNVQLSGLKIEAMKGFLDESQNMSAGMIDPDALTEDELSSDGEGEQEGQGDIIDNFTADMPTVPYEITLNLSFAPHIGLEDAVRSVKLYQQNLSSVLTGYEVVIKQQVANLSSNNEFTEDLTAKISNYERKVEDEDDATSLDSGGEQKLLTAIITIEGEGQ